MIFLKLGDICDLYSGGTPLRSEPAYYGGTIPWAKISDLETSDSSFLSTTEEYLTEAGLAAIRGRLFPVGTLLFAIYGSIGKMAFAARNMATNQAIIGIQNRDPDRLDMRYLYHALASKKDQFLSAGQGIAQKNLSASYLRKVDLALPPLEKQRRIGAILDQADDLRRKCKRQIVLARNLVWSLFNDMFGDLQRDSRAWPMVILDDLVRDQKIGLVRAASEFGSGRAHRYVRMNAITRSQEIDYSTIKTTDASPSEIAACSLVRGDFLFNTRNSRELVGKAAVWPGPDGYLFNNNIMRLRFNDRVLPPFVLGAFRSPIVQHELEVRKAGTTSVFAIYWRDLKTVRIPVPPRNLQEQFSERYWRVQKVVNSYDTRSRTLAALFASLQSCCFASDAPLSGTRMVAQ